ncbi:hypothetical protein BC351_10650 [Paenibacillus ferrarius]|uniref:Peptidase M15C domain-containing protein n=1 Tax=Paenibacillus ferrarius TaxID=1469647 RepID=A0A1V4H8U6_9BACL|nr:M15 family metallopeptidase [Paenibacillus ferrarius]OPH47640.1 hypothetical protein BC351_10650 [Paenibacillus ferrarius]
MLLSQLLNKSEARISKLHPVVATKTRQLITAAFNEGINIVIVQGLRTFEEQAALYAQGRTTAGAIVTNARAGYSMHNYGVALDFCLLADDGINVVWTVNDKWLRVGAIGKSLGFVWGGDWTYEKEGIVDYPHFEMSFGLSINDLRNGAKLPDLVETVKDEDEMKLDLNQWKMLGDSIDAWYRKGWITDYKWAEKSYKQELTLSDLAWLQSIVFSRQNGIQV